MMLRLLPPAGTKLTGRQLARTFAKALLRRHASAREAANAVGNRIGARHVIGVGSGRSALYLILKALHSLRPDRDVVAIPAYTCFSVAAAVVRAGLRIRPVDIDPLRLDFDPGDLQSLEQERLLAIVCTELFGYIGDTTRITSIAKTSGAFIVDDAAQAFGSRANGCTAGMLGDAGFYSMGRGKPLFGLSGAFIATDSDEIAKCLADVLQTCDDASHAGTLGDLARLGGYFTFFHPFLYRLADSMPFLNLGATEFDPQFPLQRLSPVACDLLMESLTRFEDNTQLRRETVAEIKMAAGTSSRFRFPEPATACKTVYPRLPVLAENKDFRDRVVQALHDAGIGASAFYPTSICDIEGIAAHTSSDNFHCRGAEQIADTLFTLPTHSLLTRTDIARIAAVLKSM